VDAASAGAVAVQRVQLSIARLGRRITAAATSAGAAGVTENHDVQVLLTLLLEGPCNPSRLSSVAGVTSGGMTALLDRLSRRGLVRRRCDPSADGRTLQVIATEKGRRAAVVLATATSDVLDARPPEVDDLLRLLHLRSARAPARLDVEAAASLMLELAARSEQHTAEVQAAAAAARLRGLEVLPGRRAYSVCCLIDLYGPQSPGAISDHVERSAATATRLVQALEGVGLVRRVPADPPRRGRAYDVELTAAGRRMARVIDRPTPALRALGRAVAAAAPRAPTART
jgi:DNA-binding MarR family transcriptional regulator